MRYCLALTIIFLFAPPVNGGVRLLGLERLYFTHEAAPGESLVASEEVLALLPASVGPGDTLRQVRVLSGFDEDYLRPRVAALEIALSGRDSPELWLRSVSLSSPEARIRPTWWALYEGSARGDVWYFDASAGQEDGKLLPNYELVDSHQDSSGIVLRVLGEMSRMEGTWWITGKLLTFGRSGAGWTLSSVENTYGFYANGREGSLDVLTESRTQGGFLTRKSALVTRAMIDRCSFREQELLEGDWRPTWDELAEAARCLTSSDKAASGFRGRDEPSFVERGWSRTDQPGSRDKDRN